MNQFSVIAFFAAISAVSAAHSQVGVSSAQNDYLQGKPLSRSKPAGYIRLAGQSGVSIEVPNDWRLLSTQELIDSAKLRAAGDTNRQLEIFALAQTPTSRAAISVEVRRPPIWTQRQLALATESTLRATSEQMQRELRGNKSQSGIGVVVAGPIYQIRVMQGAGDRAIVSDYREIEKLPKSGSIIWKTTHIHLPRASDEIEVTLSYHEKDEDLWRPVLEYVAHSLRYY